CVVAFLLFPELIMRALFMRRAFTAADAVAAGRTLAAYGLGLLPFVLIRSVTATFLARGDTATPVKAALTAVAGSVACKIALMGSLAGRARARHLDRRLAQSRAGRRLRLPPGPFCGRSPAAQRADETGGRRACARARALAGGSTRRPPGGILDLVA